MKTPVMSIDVTGVSVIEARQRLGGADCVWLMCPLLCGKSPLMAPTLAHGKIAYIEIPAIDIERSAAFYAKVFDWRIKKREDGSTAFDDPTGEVSGTWVVKRPPSPEPGLLIYIMVEDITATLDAVVAADGKLVDSIYANTGQIGRFYDPAGNVIGLYQEPGR